MSGLNKPAKQVIVVDPDRIGGVIVDPLIGITQPGGPYPPFHAILTDGMGGYTIEPTLRPYFLSFKLPCKPDVFGIPAVASGCEHQGVDTSRVGIVLPLATNLIAISVSVYRDDPLGHDGKLTIEIFSHKSGVIASLEVNAGEPRCFRRDLNEKIPAGDVIGARLVSTYDYRHIGIVTIELEA